MLQQTSLARCANTRAQTSAELDDDVRAVSAERAEGLERGVQKRTEVLFADFPRVIN